uniref:C2H2-type domain-containing protein n=1 Tax=Kwoniella pini CBS 10737 TaxID=1296096 RepID=A0A1B9HZY6_9TREE|nr:uncharacterized protein I206_05627 [Kwoniella pini CBS 10737]OCF48846.1 hypothetical protein I206_05627 [Kwoniella pini CBS 10737]
MNPFRLIQPLDLTRYPTPSSVSTEASNPMQVPISHDRGKYLENFDQIAHQSSSSNPFWLSPPKPIQPSHSAPPSAAPFQPSFSFGVNDSLRTPIHTHKRETSAYNQPLQQAQAQTPALPSHTNSHGVFWPPQAFTNQSFESPYQTHQIHQAQPKQYRPSISHGHSNSTPNFFASPYQSYQSCYGSPFQSQSQLSSTPYHIPLELGSTPPNLELPLPLQKNDSDIFASPEGTWESRSPYSPPAYDTSPFSSPRAKEKRMKSKDNLIKGRKHVWPSSLNTHMAVHTGAKPYMCSRADCQRRFSVSSNLRRHERTHELRAEKDRQTYTPSRLSQSLPMNDETPIIPNQPLFPQAPPCQFNFYQPFSTPSYSDRLPHPPAPQSGTSSSSTASSSFDGYASIGGLAQYQVVASRKSMNTGEVPPKSGDMGLTGLDLEMDTKAGLLLT